MCLLQGFEHIVAPALMSNALRYNLLFSLQHTFRSKLSCETQLWQGTPHTSLHQAPELWCHRKNEQLNQELDRRHIKVVVAVGEQSGLVLVPIGVPRGQFWDHVCSSSSSTTLQKKKKITAVHCLLACWPHHSLLSHRQPVCCHGPSTRPWTPCLIGADPADRIPLHQVPGTAGY